MVKSLLWLRQFWLLIINCVDLFVNLKICHWFIIMRKYIVYISTVPEKVSGLNCMKRPSFWLQVNHLSLVPHICVRYQAIIWTNAGILSTGPLRKTSEILIKIQIFSFTTMHLKISSTKLRPFGAGRDELNVHKCPLYAEYAIHIPY